MKIDWEQLRPVVHSNLIIVMKLAFFTLLGMCIVQRKFVPGNFAYEKRLLNLSAEVKIIVLNSQPYVESQYFLQKQTI